MLNFSISGSCNSIFLTLCSRTYLACFLLFIFMDKFIAFSIPQALFLATFNFSSTTFPVTQQIPLLSFLIYSCLVVPWMNALWLALRGISVFSLSSRKGMGTEQHGRKKKGRDVPFLQAGRSLWHYDLPVVLHPTWIDVSCKSINLHQVMSFPAVSPGCFKQIPWHPHKKRCWWL